MANKATQTIKRKIKESKVLKVAGNKYFLVTVFFFVWIFFIDTSNIFVWLNDLGTVAQQERQKEYYREAIKITEEKLKELEANKDSLEKFAREQYLFHEADEEVFVLVKEKE